MGGSVVGIFYAVEKKVNEQWKLFRLPFFLTLIVIAYSMLTMPTTILPVGIFLSALWLVFVFLYFYNNKPQVQVFVKKIIECCRNW
jgi:hypothetical protein